ncbi:hypothetical protein F6S08_12150 [Pseudomonas sp. JV449]|nr:hypothetical protein [Pseudomonas sp. JV449]
MAASSALHRQDGSGDELPNFCHESFIWDCEGGNFSGSACVAVLGGKCGRGGATIRLAPMAASGPTICWGWNEYISVAAVTAAYGSALTAGHFWKSAKSNQKRFAPPLGTSPRLGVPVIRQ